MNAVQLEEKFSEFGLQQWFQAARHAIDVAITAQADDELALGASKFGGLPDLPPEFDWPQDNGKAMAFVAQINFAQCAEHDLGKQLPAHGVLYLFYEVERSVWGYDPQDKSGFKVLFFDGDFSTLQRRALPDNLPEYADFSAGAVQFSAAVNLPDYPSALCNYEMNEDEYDGYDAWREANDGIKNKLLGHADVIQNPMEVECALVTNGLYCGDSSGYKDPRVDELAQEADQWQLLLQVDSEEDLGMMWGDSGRLYLWIKTADLQQQNFDDCWLILQCF